MSKVYKPHNKIIKYKYKIFYMINKYLKIYASHNIEHLNLKIM